MIAFSDATINEAIGVYQRVKDIMLAQEGLTKWMLRTSATVVAYDHAGSYLLHAWDSRDIIIFETDHPPLITVSDSDLRELHTWSDGGGWRLCVASRLLKDPAAFQFWLQKYREGLVYSEELQKYEDEDSVRMSEALESELKEQAEAEDEIGDIDAD